MAESTPFSFHCMICFEEFHPANHPDVFYPVVLPCGHTYVCNLCAERLDKCMECRTPLFTFEKSLVPPPPASGSPAGRSAWSSRGHSSAIATPPPKPQVKKRLPLPKNVVLLSLIEATELASQDVSKKYSGSPSRDESIAEGEDHAAAQVLTTVGSIIDTGEDEEEKIKMGTSIATGVAGTYAVVVREGLDILPSRPSNITLEEETNAFSDEDIDNLVRFFHLDNKEEDGTAKSTSPSGYKSLAKLSFGDRVQVVSVDGGWAKLARGYGYVRADKNQLVKVGSSVDRACKLEAMLQSLSNYRKELRMKQSKVDNQFIRLMSDLQASLQTDEDLTVIVADTFQSQAAKDEEVEAALAAVREEKKVASPPPEERNDTDVDLKKPIRLERQITPPNMNSPSFGCFASEVLNSFDETEGGGGLLQSFSMTPRGSRTREGRDASSFSIFPAASHPSPSEMRAGARAWRELHGRDASTGINFKTGMSGHMGLLSTHGRPHQFLEPEYGSVTSLQQQQQPNSVQQSAAAARAQSRAATNHLRMSAHTGLTMSKSRGNLMSLRIPGLGGRTTTPDSPEADSIPRMGSI